jgi:hypothetical protein
VRGIEPGQHGDHERHLRHRKSAVRVHGDDDQDQQAGYRQTDVDDDWEDVIEDATVVGGKECHHRTDGDPEEATDEPEAKGEGSTDDDDGVEVAPLLVTAERQVPRWRLQAANRERIGLLGVHGEVSNDDKEEQREEEDQTDRQ